MTLADLQQRLTAPVPPWARWAAIVVLVLAAASAGRFTGAPAATEVLDHVEVRWRERVVEHTVTQVVQAEARVVYRTIDRVVTPDAGVLEHVVEVERTDTHTEAHEDAQAQQDVEGARKSTHEVRTQALPDWRVSVQVGASLREPLVPIAGPLVLGAQIDRRIVGGVSLGVWVSTAGAAGAAVSLEW